MRRGITIIGASLLLTIGVTACSGDPGSAASSPASPDTGGSVAATATPTATAAPQVLLDVSGSGIKSTNRFTAAGDWDLAWSYDCSGFGQSGNFQVTVYGKDSSDMVDLPVNELGNKGSDVTHEHDAGTFYLEMNSECAWRVTVKG